MAEPVRFGVFGSGFMGQTWSRVIARHVPEATLVAVSGGRGAADVAREHGAEALDQDALLARGDIDAVVVATPVPTHRPIAEAAARAGKHILVEKPMTNTRADADAMVDSSRRGRRPARGLLAASLPGRADGGQGGRSMPAGSATSG